MAGHRVPTGLSRHGYQSRRRVHLPVNGKVHRHRIGPPWMRKSTVLRTPRSIFWHCLTSWMKWAWISSCQPYCAWTTQQLKCSRTTLQTRLVSSTSIAGKNGSKCCETSHSSSPCMYLQRTTWRISSPRSWISQHSSICVIDYFIRRNWLLLKYKSIKLEEAIENMYVLDSC